MATRAGVRVPRRSGLTFDRLCTNLGLPTPVPEFRFHAARKWRFDWAWPGANEGPLALEIEGGVFMQGRHSRGAGMVKDMEKYNEAAVMGWRVLRVTPKDLESAATFDLLRRALG
jgi:hypothetical protein